jgi:integrase
MRFLTPSEVERLAGNAAEAYGNLIQLAARTGLRQGEIFALRDANLELEAKTFGLESGSTTEANRRSHRRRDAFLSRVQFGDECT